MSIFTGETFTSGLIDSDKIEPICDRKSGMARERRTIRYEDDVWELLETHAKETGRPIAAIVNEAIRHYLIQTQPPLEARVATLETRVTALEEKL